MIYKNFEHVNDFCTKLLNKILTDAIIMIEIQNFLTIMLFAERLKQLRLEKQLTQEQLGKILNVRKTTISMYENGKSTPNVEKFTFM